MVATATETVIRKWFCEEVLFQGQHSNVHDQVLWPPGNRHTILPTQSRIQLPECVGLTTPGGIVFENWFRINQAGWSLFLLSPHSTSEDGGGGKPRTAMQQVKRACRYIPARQLAKLQKRRVQSRAGGSDVSLVHKATKFWHTPLRLRFDV